MMKLDVYGAARLSAAVAFLLYCNSLTLRFCLDDVAAIEENQDLRANVSWFNLLRNDFWGKLITEFDSHKSYRPLTVATFRLNYMLHELQPLGYHLVNVLLHSAVCYLYVLLCGVVFNEVWPALIAGLLFAVHPIHTEAVSGLVGRADVLCALLMFATLHCYRMALETKQRGHSALWFLLSLLCILSASLSKEIGIMITVLCIAYELILHRKMDVRTLIRQLRTEGTPKWMRGFGARAVSLVVFTVTFYLMRVKLIQSPPLFHVDNNPAMAFPTPLRQLHWSYLCVLNLWLLLSPSQLCAEYAMDTIPPISSLTDPRNLLTLATFAGLLSMGCYAMSTRDGHQRKLLFGLCLMTIPFIPASNLFFPIGFVIAERVLYIPSMGFCMVVGYGASHLTSSSKIWTTLAKIGIVCLLLSHSVKTITRNWDWETNLSLFTAGLKVSKTSAKMWEFVGNTYYKSGNNTMAEALFRKSIEVEPLFTPPRISLVRLLRNEERVDEAIEESSHTAKLAVQGINGENPHYYKSNRRIFLTLARLLLLHTDRYKEAFKWSKLAAEQEPDWEQAYDIMGKLLHKLGNHTKAVKTLKKAVELKEDFTGAHVSLGEILLELGQLDEAELHFRTASGLDSHDFLSQFRLVKLILDHSAAHTTDRLTEALNMAQEIHFLEPNNGNLTLTIALLYENLGEMAAALEWLERTAEISPDYTALYLAMGRLYYKMQKYAEADAAFTQYELHGDLNSSSLLFHRGTNYLALREYEKAQPYLSAAVEGDPDNEATLVNYGILLIHLKEYSPALDLFQRLRTEYPDNASYSQQVSVLESSMKVKVHKSEEETMTLLSDDDEDTSPSNDDGASPPTAAGGAGGGDAAAAGESDVFPTEAEENN